jgi:phage protein D
MAAGYSAVYSPRFELTVGSTTYQEAGGLIRDLVVESTVDGAALCQFTLNHPFHAEQRDFADMEWDAIEPGTDIELAIGWGGSGSLESLFVGTSKSVQVDFEPAQGPTVGVTAYGPLHDMMKGELDRSWSMTTVDTVAREVLSEYFSTTKVNGSRSQRNRVIQHSQNDYRFIRRLADEYGFEFYAEQDTVYFTPRSSIGDGSPDLTLSYGNTLDTFSAEITTADQVERVEVRYWDMNAEKEIVGSASGETGKGKEVFRIACDSKQEADNIAKSKLSKLSMTRATGYGETDGIPGLVAGDTIELKNLGERFNSTYYVTKASHRMGGSGYRTTFEVTELPE